MKLNSLHRVFLALVRAGLWEQEVRLSVVELAELPDVYRLAQEQSVVGLVAAGLENVVGAALPKEAVLPFMADVLVLEDRNVRMNRDLATLMERMRAEGIFALLVKGQGVAQCYERPLWRAAGDIDLFLDAENYSRAVAFLPTLATSVGAECPDVKHFDMQVGEWEVELHGTLRGGHDDRMDRGIDSVQAEMFSRRLFRVWDDGGTDVYLPDPDSDVVLIFTHLVKHFFASGVGLRQFCDWCRLVWTFRKELDVPLLEHRLREMDLVGVWRAFAAMAVEQFGMPASAMPLYVPAARWSRKGRLCLWLIMAMGNFGRNRGPRRLSRQFLSRKAISFWRHSCDCVRVFPIFPWHAVKLWCQMLVDGLKAVVSPRRRS